MRKILIISSMLMMSCVVFAEDTTTTETCANGAGTVITGAVSGRKYCKSNQKMNWWNANAWCDGLGRRLFSLDDCEYSATGTTACADLVGVGGDERVWTSTPSGTSYAYNVNLSSGSIGNSSRNNIQPHLNYAVCY